MSHWQESYNAGHAPCQPILSLGSRYQNPGDYRSKSIRYGIVWWKCWRPKPTKSIFLFVVLIRSSLISAESNQHPAPDNIYWGQHYISWLGGEIVAICTTDMQQCKINHCNGRRKWKSLSVERNMMLAWESRQWSNRIFWKYTESILSEPDTHRQRVDMTHIDTAFTIFPD